MEKTTITLSEICTIEKGKIGIQAAIPGQYPLVTTAEERSSHNEYHFKGEAVCIPLVSATGHGHASIKRLHYQNGKFCVGSILAACIPKNNNKTSAKFLYLYLSLLKDSILVPLMQGSANVSLKLKDLDKIEVPNIDIKEQLKVVDLIDRLQHYKDELDNELEFQQTHLQQFRQTILQEAVQGKLTKESRSISRKDDEPADKLLQRIKAEKQKLVAAGKLKKEKELPSITEDEIPFKLPKGWLWCRMGDIVSDSFYGPRFAKNDYIKDGVPTIRTTDMTDDGLININNAPKVEVAKEKIDLYKVQRNDLLITRTGSIGIMAIFKEDYLAIPSAYLIRFRFSKDVLVDYIYNYLKSPLGQLSLGINTNKSAQPNINASSINQILFPLPPFIDQQRIVDKVAQLMQMINGLEKQVEQSRTQAEQLLQAVLKETFSNKGKEYNMNDAVTTALVGS